MKRDDSLWRWGTRVAALGLGVLAVLAAPRGAGAAAPRGAGALAPAFSELLTTAIRIEQTGGADAAVEAYLTLLERAVASPATAPDPRPRLAATLAALDALTGTRYPAFLPAGMMYTLAYRTPHGVDKVTARLTQLYPRAEGPFVRSELAAALTELASYSGDAAATAKWRAAAGNVGAAAVIGPLSWPPLTGLGQGTALPGGKLAAEYAGFSPFAPRTTPTTVTARENFLNFGRTSQLDGVVAVVVDVEVPRAQNIGVALLSAQAAAVTIGTKPILTRPASLGELPVSRYALVAVSAGRVRLTVQVAKQGISATLRLRLTDQDGHPLDTRVPAVGEVAPGVATRSTELAWAGPAAGAPEVLATAAQLAVGEASRAQHLLERAELLSSATASPVLLLLFTRALAIAKDLPAYRQHELLRTAYERVLVGWPGAWEAVIGRAQQLGAQREPDEGAVQTLRELDPGKPAVASDPLVAVFAATIADAAKHRDLALQALQRVEAPLRDTALYAQLSAALGQQVGRERAKYLCETANLDRSKLACLNALRASGDFTAARAELVRLRTLLANGLPNSTLSLLLASGDSAGALALYDTQQPAEKNLGTLGLLLAGAPSEPLRQRLYRDAPGAQDAANVLLAILGSSTGSSAGTGSEPDEDSARLVAEDRAQPKMTDAATAVLRHHERYELTDTGILRSRIYDLRRLTTSADVAAGAPLVTPSVDGRSAARILRRRLFKPDGRIIESERSIRAKQSEIDLPQMESGDYVESIYQAFALPGAAGQLVLDTPDLLPERSSVGLATIELRVPVTLHPMLWSHPLLSQPVVRTEGGVVTRTWTLRGASPRRSERQVPSMDRAVRVSLGTLTWQHVGQALAQTLAELQGDDPVITAWVNAVVRPGKAAAVAPEELVSRLVEAVGKRVPFAESLDDSSPAGQWRARRALETGTGSRSALLYSALRTLGLRAEIVQAEAQAFSSAADFPAHRRRFSHSLVIAHLPKGEVWIDADIAGPPLPPGRVSVELRGRLALRPSGELIPIAASFAEAGDAAAFQLKLDERGNATGSCSIALQGRPAQHLAGQFARLTGDERTAVLRQVVLVWLPFADVDEVAMISKEGSWNIEVRAKLTLPGYAQKEGDEWVLPGLEPVHDYESTGGALLSSRFAGQGGRQNALAINSAIQYHAHRQVELPASWQVRATPNLEVKTAAIQAARRGRLVQRMIEEDFTLSLLTGTIPLAQYAPFVTALRRIDDAFLATTKAQLPK